MTGILVKRNLDIGQFIYRERLSKDGGRGQGGAYLSQRQPEVKERPGKVLQPTKDLTLMTPGSWTSNLRSRFLLLNTHRLGPLSLQP
jgi:hypothetical protein